MQKADLSFESCGGVLRAGGVFGTNWHRKEEDTVPTSTQAKLVSKLLSERRQINLANPRRARGNPSGELKVLW